MTSTYVDWGEAKVKLTWQERDHLPQKDLITSAHGFCFFDGQLMMVDLVDRGWDFPGGHIETGETPIECFKREAMEEGYVEGDCAFLGTIEVNHSENPNWHENGPYPKIGYQAFYRMDITQLHPFKAEHESGQRTFIHTNAVADYYHKWNDVYREVLASALKVEK
ncbi:NUDIX hydrolase [Pontibacillus sp. HMF3514]|uniref:NUDIX hydrolase n=1 Tax=Pontibacillus sp. HMF3514 TaxID=2692425 RepID=UPI0013205234|nr:NUDIX domain-containing protein [Pontibacillus sp. HMF3514]QHE51751.1 NUDIX domain-containing protein [Pontibacillus sp. HMF3514]